MGQRRCLGSSLAEFVQPRLEVNFPGIFMGHKQMPALRTNPGAAFGTGAGISVCLATGFRGAVPEA
jgi:hypothetical protein